MTIEPCFTDIAHLLHRELAGATGSIRVAVAWFTDRALFDALTVKAAAGLSVIVIIRNDVINFAADKLPWQRLLDAGGTLYLAPASPALHHKFCLIDDACLLTGSYNWTYGAQRNRENVLLCPQPDLMRAFRQEFNHLLDQCFEVTDVAAARAVHPPQDDVLLRQQSDEETTLAWEAQQLGAEGENYNDHLQAAGAAYCLKQYERAVAHLQQALELRPGGADAHQLLAGVHWRTGQYAQAVAVAGLAEAHGLNDAALWNTYGLAYDGLGQFKEAIGYFDRCIRAEPTVATWYYNKCMALDRSGRETLGDKIATEGIQVASNEIKHYGDGRDNHRLLRAYVERAGLRRDKPEMRKDAQAALAVYQALPVAARDLHDLDDIRKALK